MTQPSETSTSVIVRTRGGSFAKISRVLQTALIDLLPGLITCAMACVLGYLMCRSGHPLQLRSWVGVSAYGICGTWFLLRAIQRLWNQRANDRWFERFHHGLCQQCGFDLRSCTSVRCSECGQWHGTLPARHFESDSNIGMSAGPRASTLR